jgi:DNA repair protein SbcC/Rad50
MRPLRIELEGFSAYRSRETVDLARLTQTDVAFFSLTGATGAGKSSLVDAMIFALYGRIPRLGGRAVAPVISAGVDRARVRLDFEVDGASYTAVRLAQRTGSGGATVKEARLEAGDKVLADGADNVTRAVEDLLKLGFEDFTRTVVLPQGEFARFLNATPAERQNLLRGLLALDVYGKVRQLATSRQAAAEALVESARHKLDRVEVPTPEDIEELATRVAALEALEAEIARSERRLGALQREHENAGAEVTRLVGGMERLRAVRAPDRLEELGGLVADSLGRVVEAEEALKEATAELKVIEAEIAGLPEPDVMVRHRSNRESLDEVESRIASFDLDRARADLAQAETALVEAKRADAELRQRRDGLRMSHSAHALAVTLSIGEPCPVCSHEVDELPTHPAPPEMAEVEILMEMAATRLTDAEESATQARATATGLETTHTDLIVRRDELVGLLSDAPERSELERLEARFDELKTCLGETRPRVESAGVALESAKRHFEDLASDQRQMGKLLRVAQQTVADLQPPISESDDVVVEWKELLAWRDDTIHLLTAEHGEAIARSVEARSALDGARSDLAARLEAVGVVAGESFQASVAAATERARNQLTRHRETLVEVESLGAEIVNGAATAAVAKALADHLRASRFEQWMMAGALETLVVGANGLLTELSDRGYSLRSEDGAFSIIDHRNADEVRPVSTLSGGETFLVSLALALSLAEAHASEGDARLDAVILDEGFGTLDDETLDTVASVLEELARNRELMVGVITHVKELAERATVRFEVIRGAKGSTVRELT